MNTRSMIIAVVCAASLLASVFVPAYAQSPSPSPKASPSSSPKTTEDATSSAVQQNIKDRIGQVIEEKKSNGEIRRKRAIVGRVEKLNAESITIRMLNGMTENAKILDDTIMLRMPANTPQQIQDIELGAFVIAMGYLTDDEVLEVRRLLVSPLPLFPTPREVLVGKVQSITTKDITVMTRDNTERKLLLSRNTIYQDDEGVKSTRTAVRKDDEVFISVPTPVTASSSAGLVRLMK